MATCLDVAGVDYPEEYDGHAIQPLEGFSLRPCFEKDTPVRETLYWEHEGNAAIRIGDHKLVRAGINGDWELFDLAQDRTEQNNLASDQPERVKEMVTAWRSWAKSVNAIPKPAKRKQKSP